MLISRSRMRWVVALAAGLFGVGCEREETRHEPPPPEEAAPLEPCKGASAGPVAGLPGKVAGLCVDPRADVRHYGAFASSPLDAVCVQLFNGECELYKSYGLEGVKTLHYVAEDGRPLTVNVVVSSFRRSTGAFGFFTRRILGDGLPSRVTVEPLTVKGRAVTGIGMAVIWRGKEVVELTYVSDMETPEEIEQRSPRVLHPLARAIAEELVGSEKPQRGVRFLETVGSDVLGVSVLVDGMLGVSGSGPAVVGYFSEGEFPHQIVHAERRDEEGSGDLLRLLRRSGLSKKLDGRDIVRVRRTREGARPETWYMRRNDEVLLAVGPLEKPEETPSQTTPDQRKAQQARFEDFAIRRLLEVSGKELRFED